MASINDRKRRLSRRVIVGWREWGAMPDLGIPAIKVKIDSGARSSALHAISIRRIRAGGRDRVRFGLHPIQRRSDIEITCESDVLDQRIVTDSGGHREKRFVIEVNFALGEETWPIELTLSHREPMMFRMLLGRTAMKGRITVDPSRSYVAAPRVIKPARLYAALKAKP